MTRYKIAVKDNAFALQQEVSSLLEQGWEPLGGIAMTVRASDGQTQFAQALTKRAPLQPCNPQTHPPQEPA